MWGFGQVGLQDQQPWCLRHVHCWAIQRFPGDRAPVCCTRGSNLAMLFNEKARLGRKLCASFGCISQALPVLLHCI